MTWPALMHEVRLLFTCFSFSTGLAMDVAPTVRDVRENNILQRDIFYETEK